MSDEAAAAPELPPLPDMYEIPQEHIDRWNAITSAQSLEVPLGKHQLDNLMISLRQSIQAQMALGNALQLLTMNDVAQAQVEFRRHQELTRYAYSNVNWFISHVMTAATPLEPNNG
jgi:hypothetical protein